MESMVMKMTRKEIAHRPDAPRPRGRRSPSCEALEGRQLLSTTTGALASGLPAWRSGGGATAADIAHAHSGNGGGEFFHRAGSADVAHTGPSGSFTPGEFNPAFRSHFAAAS
jgi:environmental stress-induced protein Ves